MKLPVANKLVVFLLIAATTAVVACGERAENGDTPAPLIVAPEAIFSPTAEAAASDELDDSPAGGESDGATTDPAPVAQPAADTTQPAASQEELPLVGEPSPAPATESCVVYQNARVADEQLPVVYREPSVQAEAIGRLGRNHWTNGVGWRSGWFEIVVEPEKTGWVWASSVATNAPCTGLQPQATVLPIIGLPTVRPATGCVVSQNVRVEDASLPLVYAAPSVNAAQVARLGRSHWADGLQRQGEWIEIVVQAGATGWVRESGVALSADCLVATASPPPELPLIANRGAPANTRCVVMNLWGEEQPVPVYGGPDAGQPPVAYLTGWADVQRLGESWHEILIPAGGSGWVEARNANVSVGCGQDGPLRMDFPAGTTSQTLEGKMPAAAQISFVFWARAGQVATVRVIAPGNNVLFHLEGTGNGEVYKQLLDGEGEWQGTLNFDQDYLLTLDNAGPAATAYTVELGLEQ